MVKFQNTLPPSGTAPLRVSLLLGSFVHGPAALDLFDLHVPPPASESAPVHPDESFYHLRPELAHTFRPEPKLPPRPVGRSLWSGACIRTPSLYGSGAAALALLTGNLKQALVGIAARRTVSSK
ncbi:hypothetical protein EDB84DRAFT_316564 [Lactarius hengduanensis]|nr:hypothetical protein EDB84DRAFT_316564 [Lactarius hengduanensis]